MKNFIYYLITAIISIVGIIILWNAFTEIVLRIVG